MKTTRSLTGLALGLMMCCQLSTAVAATYSYSYGTSSDAVSYVRNRGFMTGYANGTFGENNLVNRAEFAKVVTLIYSSTVPPIYTTTLPFRDTANNAWYSPYIVYVFGNGLMTGYPDNSFHPDSPVAFDEAAKVLSTIYRLNITTNTNLWYEGPVRALASAGAIPTSITSFDQYLTRGQLADIIYRLDSGNRGQSSQTYADLAQRNGNTNSGDCGNNQNLEVTIDPQDSTPSAGGTLSYDIHVQNCGNDDERVDVVANLDSQVTYDSSSDNGYLNGSRAVQWNDVDVQSGDEEVITLRVRLQNYTTNNDQVDLNVRATDNDNDSDSDTNTVYVSGSNNNCNSNVNNNCYYDSNNNYICNNNSNNNSCYYDSNNNYICNNNNNNSNNNCYYDSNNNYICNNNNNNSNNCYYDSNNNYICNNNNNSNNCSSNSNCYYDSNNNYICNNNNNSNNNCYYDSNNNYICNNNGSNNCSDNCYYDNNGRYICSDNSNTNCNNNNSNNTVTNGNLSLTLSEDSVQPQPNDIIRYTITIRNNNGTSGSFNVRSQFSPDLTFVSGSNSVQITDSRSVYWNSVYIDGYQTVQLTLKLKVRTAATNGERLDMNISVNNGSNNQSVNQVTSVYVRNPNSNNGNCYYDSNNNYICNNNGSNNCYYDSNNNYICNNNNNSCYYNSSGQYICNNGGNTAVSLREDSNSARVGDIDRTYITITNNRNTDDYVNLQANLDPDLTYISASNSPTSTNNGFIQWNRLFVRANGTLTVTLDSRIGTFASIGDQLRINVSAAGSTNTASDTEYINVRS